MCGGREANRSIDRRREKGAGDAVGLRAPPRLCYSRGLRSTGFDHARGGTRATRWGAGASLLIACALATVGCGGDGGPCGASCDDGDPCTHDACATATGGAPACVHVPVVACAEGCGAPAGCGWSDRDGDGLGDTWEANGYIDLDCNGRRDEGVDTPLPRADPDRPNLYVKWDYMAQAGAHSHRPGDGAMELVRAAFARRGVLLEYFPMSDALDEHAVVSLAAPGALPACAGDDAVSLYALKAEHFPPWLAPAYHYAVFAHFNSCASDGECARCPATAKGGTAPQFGAAGIAERPGNDLIVSLGRLVDMGAPLADLVVGGAFMHELGHNLGLRHGGGDDTNGKPNYLSVMNYAYEFGIGSTNAPGPFATGPLDPATQKHLDYSDFAAGALDEGRFTGAPGCGDDGSGGMSEPAGLVGAGADRRDVVVLHAAGGRVLYAPSNGSPVDWSGDGAAADAHVFADVSGDGGCQALAGFDDWALDAAPPGVVRLSHLSLAPSCGGGGYWADGAPLVPAIEDDEPTAARLVAEGRLPSFVAR